MCLIQENSIMQIALVKLLECQPGELGSTPAPTTTYLLSIVITVIILT